jgi:hypothetical protein
MRRWAVLIVRCRRDERIFQRPKSRCVSPREDIMLHYVSWASFWIFALTISAEARWKEQYANAPDAVRQWYTAQRNKNGTWCCDQADGHAFYGSYSLDRDGGIEFDAGGVHHKLPSYMVLDGPNPTGHAVWWYTDQPDGVHHDYCFALGSQG